MPEENEIKKVVENMIEDEMRGCVLCNSHVDLVYCEGIESPITGKSPSLLCYVCRQEGCFTEEGLIDDEKLAECFNLAWDDEDDEDWDDEDDEDWDDEDN